ncbi:cation transporter dimerization domain-containing protein, partial [Salmonella enterica]|uniref:cation transporter dimerization domain-containing protein n=1 Tax=Salmonella enterica TaxID=28901 RepID=UPI00398C403A
IIDIVTPWPGVSGAHHIPTRWSWRTRIIQMPSAKDDNPSLFQSHFLAEHVQLAILAHFPA